MIKYSVNENGRGAPLGQALFHDSHQMCVNGEIQLFLAVIIHYPILLPSQELENGRALYKLFSSSELSSGDDLEEPACFVCFVIVIRSEPACLIYSSSSIEGTLDVIFGKGEYYVVDHKEWAAYPKLDPLVTWSSCGGSTSSPCYPILPFSGHSILYLNALEMAVSAIEVCSFAPCTNPYYIYILYIR